MYIQKYKNNQTTSTKCQYQAEHSKPIWCFEEKELLRRRIRVISRHAHPTVTWKP